MQRELESTTARYKIEADHMRFSSARASLSGPLERRTHPVEVEAVPTSVRIVNSVMHSKKLSMTKFDSKPSQNEHKSDNIVYHQLLQQANTLMPSSTMNKIDLIPAIKQERTLRNMKAMTKEQAA